MHNMRVVNMHVVNMRAHTMHARYACTTVVNTGGAPHAQEREVTEAREAGGRAADTDEAAVREMQEREERLAQALAEAQASLGTMQRLHRGAQDKLFELQSASDDTAATSTAELDISALELERASERCGPAGTLRVALTQCSP